MTDRIDLRPDEIKVQPLLAQAASDAYQPGSVMRNLDAVANASGGDFHFAGDVYRTAASDQSRGTNTKGDIDFSVSQLAGLVDSGLAQHDLNLPASFMFSQIQRSFNQGGADAAQHLVDSLDGAIQADGVGPMIRNDGNRLSMHLVQEMKTPPTAEQMRTGEYFQQSGRYFHDLVKPQDIDQSVRQNAESQRLADQNAERTGEVRGAADTITNDPQFARTGKLSESAARQFASQLGRHDGEMPAFINEVNAELARRGSSARFSVDVIPHQPGMHGNTVTAYHIQSFNRVTGNRQQSYYDGHDTVRGLSANPMPTFHWEQN